jgi:hypothetical protein
VKKWDNRMFGEWNGWGLPRCALCGGWFSKTGLELKSNDENRSEGYPLFKGQRLLLLVFLLFLSSLLEAVAPGIGKEGSVAVVSQKRPRFPQRNQSRSKWVPP